MKTPYQPLRLLGQMVRQARRPEEEGAVCLSHFRPACSGLRRCFLSPTRADYARHISRLFVQNTAGLACWSVLQGRRIVLLLSNLPPSGMGVSRHDFYHRLIVHALPGRKDQQPWNGVGYRAWSGHRSGVRTRGRIGGMICSGWSTRLSEWWKKDNGSSIRLGPVRFTAASGIACRRGENPPRL